MLQSALCISLVFIVSFSLHIPSITGAPLPDEPAGALDAFSEMFSTFQAMDTNKDDAVILAEVKAAEQKIIACVLNNAKGGVPTNEFKVLDVNGNGKLGKEEFISDKSKKTSDKDSQTLKAAFDLLDKNKDGQLTPDEFGLILFAQTMEATKRVDQDFKQADLDKDGKLTFSEVLDLFTAIGRGKIESTNAVALAFGKMYTQCLED